MMNTFIQKYQLSEHVFNHPFDAKAKSMGMGLGGRVHVMDINGQAMYIPGATHKEYMDYMRQGWEEPEMEDDEEEDDSEEVWIQALRIVVEALMNKSDEWQDWGEEEEITKAEYQGREVPLNKPRRLSGGNKKFEVFVQDGGKVKRVTFGDPNMEIRRDDDKARASFRARHSCDTARDKTSARYWSCRMWEKDTTVSEATKSDFEVIKVDTEQRIIYGWASVTKVDDELLVDRQGDIIETETLHKAVNDFMKSVRVGKLMHQGEKVGEIIHSFPVSKEIMGALGIQTNKEGWITGYYVEDDNLWEDVKSGKYAAFSIGGAAVKEEYNA